MVSYVREENVVVVSFEEADERLCRTTVRTSCAQLLGTEVVSEMLCGSESEPAASHRAAATMGHGPFHCIAPPLTSLAAVTNTLAPPLCHPFRHSTTTHLR